MSKILQLTLACFVISAVAFVDLYAQRRRPVPFPDASSQPYVSIAAGGSTACAIRANGTAWCWGEAGYGQLGNGSFEVSYRPVKVAGGPWEQISMGGETACGNAGGRTWCWGSDRQGALGLGFLSTGCGGTSETNSGCSPTPLPVAGDFSFFTLASGGNLSRRFMPPRLRFNCGITSAGVTLCWGDDANGTLGDGAEYPAAVPFPQPVLSDEHFVQISAGFDNTCALDTEGRPWCWGLELWGELGDDDVLESVAAEPTPVATSLRFREIETARNHTCGITLAGEMYCWGLGASGQLGNMELDDCSSDPRYPMPCTTSPVRVASDEQFSALALGIAHTCGIDDSGNVWCWGMGSEVGVGWENSAFSPCPGAPRLPCALAPLRAATSTRFVSIDAGWQFTCALSADGEVFCWGQDPSGLAQGVGMAVSVPTRIVGPEPRNGHAGASRAGWLASDGLTSHQD